MQVTVNHLIRELKRFHPIDVRNYFRVSSGESDNFLTFEEFVQKARVISNELDEQDLLPIFQELDSLDEHRVSPPPL